MTLSATLSEKSFQPSYNPNAEIISKTPDTDKLNLIPL
jgi:hypothetical protein